MERWPRQEAGTTAAEKKMTKVTRRGAAGPAWVLFPATADQVHGIPDPGRHPQHSLGQDLQRTRANCITSDRLFIPQMKNKRDVGDINIFDPGGLT
jgi:hypothetical protein